MSRLDDLRAAMAREMPYGWQWSVAEDAYGPVCSAWRTGPGVPESVHLEARSAGDLADEVAVYLDGLQAAFEIATGRPSDPLDDGYGGLHL
jgi:hypothetical protein